MDHRKGSAPKTVIRGALPAAGDSRAGGPPDPLPKLAQPLVDFSRDVERDPRPDPRRLAEAARDRIATFEREARRAGVADDAVLDARDALAALVDARARNNPALPLRGWEQALRAELPLGEGATADAVRERARVAAAGGASRRDLARFLAHCSEAIDGAQAAGTRRRAVGGIWWAAAIAMFVVALAAWAGLAEWNYRARILAGLPDPGQVIAAGLSASPSVRTARLDAMAAAIAEAERGTAGSPLGLIGRIAALDPAVVARDNYRRAAAALLEAPLGEALGLALATEGEPGALYDTLRAWSILDGRSPWQSRYVEGWLTERADTFPDLMPLVPHVAALAGPMTSLPPPDPEALGQSRQIAAEGTANERAAIELRRSDAAMALPRWTIAEGVPGLADVVVLRSGRPVSLGIDGLYTAAGWSFAEQAGVADAIATADREAKALLGQGGRAETAAVLDDLQRRTLEAWSSWLADLRVKPFADQPTAVLISGALSVRNSPLSALIDEVWRQVGGEDRTRSHPNQLRIAAEFGPAVQFVEQGRMAEISQLFAALNVVLATMGRTSEVGSRQLLDVRGRAASIVALQQAPTLVVQIVEDVLAQSAAPVPSAGAAPVAAASAQGSDPVWQSEVFEVCRAAVEGRYPFADGPDADLAQLADAFGPSGSVRRYFAREAVELMDMSGDEWRWKPEARLAGRSPESAVFLQRVATIGDALFGTGMVASVPLRLEALAQRGAATISIGGASAPVVVNGAPVDLAWPGPDPGRGFQIAFESAKGPNSQRFEGAFGLLRAMDGVRLRPRDGGKRFLVDVRLEPSRAYFQMSFAGEANPVSVRSTMRGLGCPPSP